MFCVSCQKSYKIQRTLSNIMQLTGLHRVTISCITCMYLMMKWSIINISGLICQIFLGFFPSKICKHSLTSIQFITLSDNHSYDDYKNDITMLRLRTLQHDLVCNVIIWPETKNILQRFQFKISSDRTIQYHSAPIHFLGTTVESY